MLPNSLQVFVYAAPTSMSRSIDALSALVTSSNRNPAVGIFAFFNRRRDRVKLLWKDDTGWCILYKRLDGHRFDIVTGDIVSGALTISSAKLAELLKGVAFTRRRDVDVSCCRRLALTTLK
jgi:transposase